MSSNDVASTMQSCRVQYAWICLQALEFGWMLVADTSRPKSASNISYHKSYELHGIYDAQLQGTVRMDLPTGTYVWLDARGRHLKTQVRF
jgi:hypothetical protein